MRPNWFKSVGLALCLTVGAVLLTGCPSKKEPNDMDLSVQTGKGGKGGGVEETPLRPGEGTLRGKVTIVGQPNTELLTSKLQTDMKKDPNQKSACFDTAPDKQREQQDWKIGKGNGLGDVFVYLKPIKGTYFGFDPKDENDKKILDSARKTVEIDQPHCVFMPHTQKYWPSYRNASSSSSKPVATGQKLVIKNSAKTTHNFKIGTNDVGNMPPGAKEDVTARLTASNDLVNYGCSIHSWMNGSLLAPVHPYVAITDEDGNYEIKNVPAGDVLICAVHPRGIFLNDNEGKGEPISLSKGETPKDFTLKYKGQ